MGDHYRVVAAKLMFGNRKADIGAASVNVKAARKRPLAKKIADTEGDFFLLFQNWRRGCGWVFMPVFPDSWANFAFDFSTRHRRLCE
jgi:hypothetical protein